MVRFFQFTKSKSSPEAEPLVGSLIESEKNEHTLSTKDKELLVEEIKLRISERHYAKAIQSFRTYMNDYHEMKNQFSHKDISKMLSYYNRKGFIKQSSELSQLLLDTYGKEDQSFFNALRGMSYFLNMQFSEAIYSYDVAISTRVSHKTHPYKYYFMLGMSYLCYKDYDNAKVAFNRANIPGKNQLYIMAIQGIKLCDKFQGIAENTALNGDYEPKLAVDAIIYAAIVYIAHGEHLKAQCVLQESLKRNPHSVPPNQFSYHRYNIYMELIEYLLRQIPVSSEKIENLPFTEEREIRASIPTFSLFHLFDPALNSEASSSWADDRSESLSRVKRDY